MGIDTEFKRWLRRRYPDAWVNAPTNDRRFMETEGRFFLPNIVIFDYTYKLKIPPFKKKGKDESKKATSATANAVARSGHDYFVRHFIGEVVDFFNRGARLIYLCFDRGSPKNKQEEHIRRKGKTKPTPTPEDDDLILVDDETLPADWKGFVSNRAIAADLVYYVTQKIMSEKSLGPLSRSYVFLPPRDCTLCIHGGREVKPDRKNPSSTPPSKGLLYVNHKATLVSKGDGMRAKEYSRESGRFEGTEKDDLSRDNILEGEIACLYYTRCHPNDNLLIVTADGDLIPLLLLASKDRIDPITGRFKNAIFLQLHIPCDRDQYVDINKLYVSISKDLHFNRMSVKDPVLTICSLCCLIKNDFIKGYCPGIGYYKDRKGGNDENDCPWVVRNFLKNAKRFGNMVELRRFDPIVSKSGFHRDDVDRGSLDRRKEIRVNEGLFIEFTKTNYVAKYGEQKNVRKIYGDDPTVENVREFLKNPKRSKRTRMMVSRKCRVFSRQLEWILEYWINGYREICQLVDPTLIYRNLPYYGWNVDASSGVCGRSSRVSIRCGDGDGFKKPWTPAVLGETRTDGRSTTSSTRKRTKRERMRSDGSFEGEGRIKRKKLFAKEDRRFDDYDGLRAINNCHLDDLVEDGEDLEGRTKESDVDKKRKFEETEKDDDNKSKRIVGRCKLHLLELDDKKRKFEETEGGDDGPKSNPETFLRREFKRFKRSDPKNDEGEGEEEGKERQKNEDTYERSTDEDSLYYSSDDEHDSFNEIA